MTGNNFIALPALKEQHFDFHSLTFPNQSWRRCSCPALLIIETHITH